MSITAISGTSGKEFYVVFVFLINIHKAKIFLCMKNNRLTHPFKNNNNESQSRLKQNKVLKAVEELFLGKHFGLLLISTVHWGGGGGGGGRERKWHP